MVTSLRKEDVKAQRQHFLGREALPILLPPQVTGGRCALLADTPRLPESRLACGQVDRHRIDTEVHGMDQDVGRAERPQRNEKIQGKGLLVLSKTPAHPHRPPFPTDE